MIPLFFRGINPLRARVALVFAFDCIFPICGNPNNRRPSWSMQGIPTEGHARISPCRRIPFQPFRLFDSVDSVTLDHVGAAGHVDHGLVETAVRVEFVHSGVVAV